MGQLVLKKVLPWALLVSWNVWGQAGLELPNPLRKIKVMEVRTEGNRTVDKSRILSAVHITSGSEYLPPVLKQKIRASIRDLYKTHLFSEISVDLTASPSEEGVFVTFQVVELPTLGKISLKGYKKIDEKKLREKMDLIEGQVFSRSSIERERQEIIALYREEGFLLAAVNVSQELDGATERIDLTFKINEGKKVKVRDVLISGNEKVKARKLRSQMDTKKKSWFFGVGGEYKEEEFVNSLDSIAIYYRNKGFLDASVVSHSIRYSSDKRFMTIDIAVSEGRQYKFGRAKFIHNDIMDERSLAGQMILKKDEVAGAGALEGSKFQIESLYRNMGYLFVQVMEERSYRDSIVDVAYTIREGNLAHINMVHVRGNTKTKDKVIRREIRIFPGDIFSQALVIRSQREVLQLNFFDNVMPNYEPVGDDDVDLIFEVAEKEAGTGTFSAGAAFSGRDGLVGTLGLQIPNFLGNGQQADLNLEWGQNKQLASVGFTEPWFLDTPTLVGGSVFWQSVRNFNYIPSGLQGSEWLTSYGFRVKLGRRLTWPDDYFSVVSHYNLTQNKNGFLRSSDKLLQQSGLESSVSVTLSRDDKDLPVFPTDGSKYALTYRKYGGLLGGNFNYDKYETSVKWWFPTIAKFVLGLHSEFGIMDGPNLNQLDLYQMGGTLGFNGKLRGFRAGEIGRYTIGRSYFSLVSELTYPIAERVFYVLGFFDMGNVYGDSPRDFSIQSHELDSPIHDVDLSDLLMGYGAGFRLIIPMMGRIGFDFAWNVGDSYRNGRSIAREGMDWHFVLEAPFD